MSDWTDIGEQLRVAREARAETLKDVEFVLRIPDQVLNELEANDYSSFSSPTYAKSFLRQYSEYLEVDAQRWLDAFETGNSLANIDDFEYLHGDSYGGATHEEIRKARLGRSSQTRMKMKAGYGAIFAVAIFAVIGGLGFYFFKQFEERFSNSEGNAAQTEAATEPKTNFSRAPGVDQAAPSVAEETEDESVLIRATNPAATTPRAEVVED